MSSISEKEYEERATAELRALVDALDNIEDDDVEAELASDILSVEFGDGGKFVINSHRAARQIWMAAERNAWHFDWIADQGAWIAAKTGDELWATLHRVIAEKLGHEIELARS